MVKWILEKREEINAAVSTEMIRLKGLSLIKASVPEFKASDGWLRKFLSRDNGRTCAIDVLARRMRSDLEDKITQFCQNVHCVRENGDFPYDLIANMDKTPAYFDIVPSKTVDKKGKNINHCSHYKIGIAAYHSGVIWCGNR